MAKFQGKNPFRKLEQKLSNIILISRDLECLAYFPQDILPEREEYLIFFIPLLRYFSHKGSANEPVFSINQVCFMKMTMLSTLRRSGSFQ